MYINGCAPKKQLFIRTVKSVYLSCFIKNFHRFRYNLRTDSVTFNYSDFQAHLCHSLLCICDFGTIFRSKNLLNTIIPYFLSGFNPLICKSIKIRVNSVLFFRFLWNHKNEDQRTDKQHSRIKKLRNDLKCRNLTAKLMHCRNCHQHLRAIRNHSL